MIRNAGRGDDGLAKPISTNNAGNIRTSQIKETKRLRHIDDVPSGETITLVDTDKEVIIHSLVCHFSNDIIIEESLQMWFGTGTTSQTAYSIFAPEIERGHSSYIIPSYCIYDGLLETLVNEPGKRIVQLKNELHVKGLKIGLTNRGDNPNKMKLMCVYSEVE